jgi:acyl-CoA thioester hydrolase
MTAQAITEASRRTVAPVRGEFRFWTHEKLRNADTDQFRHVNNAVISTLFEAARMEIFASPAIRELMDGGNLAIARLLVEFRKEVHFPGHVDIGSTVVAVGKTSVRIAQGLFAANGEDCHASAEAICVIVNPKTGVPCPIGAELRRHLLAGAAEGVSA